MLLSLIQAALTIESLFYNTFFSNLNQCSERLRCESCNSIEAHEVMICCNAPPVLIIHLSPNNNAENPTSTPICVPSALVFRQMLGIIIAFYLKVKANALHLMTPFAEKLSHDVLLNANDQRYIQVVFYVRDPCPYQQSFIKDLRMPSVENEEILKTVEKLITGEIKCPGNIQSGDIYDLVMGKNITGSIISSFLIVLIENDVDVEVVCPLFFASLLNKERVTNSIKYVISNPNLMKKGIYLFRST